MKNHQIEINNGFLFPCYDFAFSTYTCSYNVGIKAHMASILSPAALN